MNSKLFSPQINTCYTVPCASTGENECLWTDWLLDNSLNGEQARQYACIRRSDTTCSWYRGGPPPEKDFLDMTDPWPVILTFSSLHFTPAKSNTPCFRFCSSKLACTVATDFTEKLTDFYIRGSLTQRWAFVRRGEVVATGMLGTFSQSAGAFNIPPTHSLALAHSTPLAVFHRIGIAADHPLQIIHPRVNLFFISDGLMVNA